MTGIRFSDAYCMISRPVVVSPVKAILRIRLDEASGLPASTPNPLTMFSTPGGSRSPIMSISSMIDAGVCSAGFSTTALPAASAGASFQIAIRIGKFHGNDLPDNAQRLVEVVGDGVLVDLRQRALLGPDRAGEVAEMVDRQRDVGVQRLADRLAVVPGLGDGDLLEVLLDPVGDLVQNVRALGRPRSCPSRGGVVRGVQGEFDILGGATGRPR